MPPSRRELTRERETFFRSLPSRAGRVLPCWAAGVVLIKVEEGDGGEFWRVAMRDRAVVVDRGSEPADATVVLSADLFHDLITGADQLIAALLRNEATVVGEVALLLVFRRFFPSAPGSGDPRDAVGGSRWRERMDETVARSTPAERA
ncbi:SCP2 sterol-binding domain-containing protein [Micromonospora sp. NPDC047527]|uniref:SCP2 sterol-binding domain-containing protein n=1 Tax=unclassified Micromonospora TaxID=2617518 RepID=UPI0033EAC408